MPIHPPCGVVGTPGDDELEIDESYEVACGLGGNDVIRILDVLDASAYGGSGDDVLRGGTGEDYLFGGHGDDVLRGRSERDYLHGGPGADLLVAGASDSFANDVHGGSGPDELRGGTDKDWLDGLGGSHLLLGGGGDDFIKGGRGNDRCLSTSDGDTDDRLLGGPGVDGYEADEGDIVRTVESSPCSPA